MMRHGVGVAGSGRHSDRMRPAGNAPLVLSVRMPSTEGGRLSRVRVRVRVRVRSKMRIRIRVKAALRFHVRSGFGLRLMVWLV